MTKRQKILDKWELNTPQYAKIDEVLAILDRFFPGSRRQRGSHIIVEDERLKQLNDIALLGVLTVPVKGGQQVKGFYLKRIAEAIKHIQGETEKQ